MFENETKVEKLSQQQIIRQKIKELKELESIEKKIAKCNTDKQKLIIKKSVLEKKYGL